MPPILVLNSGSSSIKFALFDSDLAVVLAGQATGIGGGTARLQVGDARSTPTMPDPQTALDAILHALTKRGHGLSRIAAVAHRVVHGGSKLTRPVRITPRIREDIAACTALAPLHNPQCLAAMDALEERTPGLPQCASFDTAFHATNPEVATRYAIPRAFEEMGIRRYGFHGLSYASLVRRWPEITGTPLPKRLLAFHLGNGASICAIRDGRSIATTMGYSPLDGLTMGTRAGNIDGNAVLRLVETEGLAATRHALNKESGLVALSGGLSDMRALCADSGEASRFAIAHFCYWAVRHAGSQIAALQGCDAIAFTGGIGENAAEIRTEIMSGLAWAGLTADAERNIAKAPRLHADGSSIEAWIIPADEERVIAADALGVLNAA